MTSDIDHFESVMLFAGHDTVMVSLLGITSADFSSRKAFGCRELPAGAGWRRARSRFHKPLPLGQPAGRDPAPGFAGGAGAGQNSARVQRRRPVSGAAAGRSALLGGYVS